LEAAVQAPLHFGDNAAPSETFSSGNANPENYLFDVQGTFVTPDFCQPIRPLDSGTANIKSGGPLRAMSSL